MSKSEPAVDSSIATGSAVTDTEHFEFSVPAEGIAVVRNTKHDAPTTYAVNVDESGETVACGCPADEYHPGPCKHRQAVESQACVLLAATMPRGDR